MAFTSLFPSNSSAGGLLGGTLGGGTSLAQRPIIGVDSSIIAASFDAQQTQAVLRAINSAAGSSAFSISQSTQETANRLPVVGEDTGDTLTRRVNEIRQNRTFIDLNDPRLDGLQNDGDRQATFALTIALDRLRSLAELAADRTTTDSTRSQIDSLFREGLAEVRSFVETQETDLLNLQFGSRSSRVESETSLGRDQTDYNGDLLSTSRTEALSGLTGTETFTISLANTGSGVSDQITVNLADITGDLSLDNIVSLVNERIGAIQATDSEGALIFDDQGDPVSRYQTEFEVYSANGRFGLRVDRTLTETVSLSSASADPALIVASTSSAVDGDTADRVRVTTLDNIASTITVGSTTSFAATDIDETKLLEETADVLIPEREVDEDIAARRDEIRAAAEAEIAEANTDPFTNETTDFAAATADLIGTLEGVDIPITDVTNDTRVQANTAAGGVAVDSFGNVYVVGQSEGTFGSEINTSSTQDVFLTKLDNRGNVIFSRLLGASDSADGFAVTVDASDNVIIAGQTNSAIQSGDLIDTNDAFVAKFNSSGDEQFRFQLDTFGTTSGLALATDTSGSIFVGGSTSGSIGAGSTFSGVTDGLLLQLNGSTGAIENSALIGGAGREVIKDLAFNDSGELLIALEEDGQAVLRKRSTGDLSTDTASITLGSLGTGGALNGIAVEGNNVFLSGTTRDGALTAGGTITPTGSENGSQDGFVSGFTDTGTAFTGNFTSFVGTSEADQIVGVTVNGGSVFVAGVTQSTLAGETSVGATDSFVTRINGTTGALEDSQQFGASFTRTESAGIAFTQQGDSVLSTLGLPAGEINPAQNRTITDQTSARVGDFFTLEVDNNRTRITIEENDTFIDIRRKIRIAALGQVQVTVSSSSTGDGEDIRIETVRGGSAITLTPGTGGRDALERLGIESGTILPTDVLFRDLNDPDQAEELGGTFGLGIELPINISDLTNATYSLERLDNAIAQVGRAFRSLSPNPLAALLNDPLRDVGPPPPRLANQIANFQSGLQRLQSSSPSTGLSLFI